MYFISLFSFWRSKTTGTHLQLNAAQINKEKEKEKKIQCGDVDEQAQEPEV